MKSVINVTQVKFKFQKLTESEYYIFLFVQVIQKNKNQTIFYIEYSQLDFVFTNKLCELAGFENFHSIYHMQILKNKEKVLAFQEFLPNYPFL